ncbi:MAG: LptF/LptG family permease [Chlamydiota bacterium]
MPIIWRYLLERYLKTLLLSVVAFITILMITRLDEVARFAAMGAPIGDLGLFALYQLPYILPIAIPISCLIAAMVLYLRLSHTHELTALRAAGFSINHIIAPVIIASGLLMLVNLYVVSELATESHLSTKKLQNKFKSVNPLLILQTPNFFTMRGAYADVLGKINPGEYAEDVIFAVKNSHNSRLHLASAHKINFKDNTFSADNFRILYNIAPSEEAASFDDVFVENISSFATAADELTRLLTKEGWKLNNDHLKFRLLLVKLNKKLSQLASPAQKLSQVTENRRQVQVIISEIARRFSVTLATLTFTLMGCAFGIELSRTPTRKGVITVASLAFIYLLAFFTARGFDQNFPLAAFLYFAPHLAIIWLSLKNLKRVNQGLE